MILVAHRHDGAGIKISPAAHPKRFRESKCPPWGGPRGFGAERGVIGVGAGHTPGRLTEHMDVKRGVFKAIRIRAAKPIKSDHAQKLCGIKKHGCCMPRVAHTSSPPARPSPGGSVRRG